MRKKMNISCYKADGGEIGSMIGSGLDMASNAIPVVGPFLSKLGIFNKIGGAIGNKVGRQERSFTIEPQFANPYGNFANGGYMKYLDGGRLLELEGNTHEQGGIQLGQIEAEDEEVIDTKNQYIFSDRLGKDKNNKSVVNYNKVKTSFADIAKKINKKYKDKHDRISLLSKELELAELIKDNEITRQRKDDKTSIKAQDGLPLNTTFWNKDNYLPEIEPMGSPALSDEGFIGPQIRPKVEDKSLQREQNRITKRSMNAPEDITAENRLGLTAGDKTQLASLAPSLIYNTAQALRKTEKEPHFFNPNEDKIERTMRERTFNDQQIVNDIRLNERANRDIIDASSTSDAIRRANLVKLNSNSNRAIADARIKGQEINNQYRAQEASMLDNLGQQKVGEQRRVSEVNALNKAKKQLFGAQVATDLGKGIADVGKFKNTQLLNEQKLGVLNSISTDYNINVDNPQEIIQFKESGLYDMMSEEEKAVLEEYLKLNR